MSECVGGVPADHFFPAIPGMESLFGQPLFAFNPEAEPGIGFRRKSSIVIEGPPGSGKTAATLAICRALMPAPANLMYYLSTEVTKERLFKNHAEFGWFNNFAKAPNAATVESGYPFTKENLFFAELPRARTDRPLPSSAEQINDIFRGISDYRRKPDRRGHSSLIVVDSLSGLLRDASTAGERRRLTEDFLERLETEFDKDLGLVFLITESSTGRCDETPLEQYVADYVFRLGYKEVTGGRRVRTWDIVKSHGTYMAAGEHTWDFFTEATADSLFFDSDLKNYVWTYSGNRHPPINPVRSVGELPATQVGGSESDAMRPKDQSKSSGSSESGETRARSATIVIYPQWTTYLTASQSALSRRVRFQSPTRDPNLWSGTPGLDELLQGDTEYWSRADRWSQNTYGAKWSPGLRPGETTLFLGSSGTGKTWILLQFLYGNLHDDGRILSVEQRADLLIQQQRFPGLERKRVHAEALKRTLFLSFEGTSDSLRSLMKSSQHVTTLSRRCLSLFVAPSGVHLNRLLFELRWIVTNKHIDRVAIDGLADLSKSMIPEVRAGVAAAIFRTLQYGLVEEKGIKRPTIFATYELNPHDTSLAPEAEGISAICENVLVLRQIRLNDQMHKAMYVLKAQSRRHDRQVREVIVNSRDTGTTPGVRVQSGFEGFSEILSGAPKKARVALQLFSENSEEQRYNVEIRSRLSRAFSFGVDLRTFSHSELSLFLDGARGVLGQVPATDIKVITLDEWWLRDLQRAPKIPRSQEGAAETPPSPLLRVDGFFALKDSAPEEAQMFPLQQERSAAANQGLASEHWITEVEKGVRTSVRREQRRQQSQTETSAPGLPDGVNTIVSIDAELQAMPHYSDFGLFCINTQAAADQKVFKGKKLKSRDQLPVYVPALWARPIETAAGHHWFLPPGNASHPTTGGKYKTVVDLLFQATTGGQHPEYGFAFDMSIGETAICFLMELAWSFGVEEGFLSEAAIKLVRSKGHLTAPNLQADALRSAFRLLQYLVFHGLMVPFPSAKESAQALFSRQWYSTMNTGPEPASTRSAPATTGTPQRPVGSTQPVPAPDLQDHVLVPIPFFPVGMLPCDIRTGKSRLILAELSDAQRHLSGICHRVAAALEWIVDYRRDIVPRHGDHSEITKTVLQESADAVESIREQVTLIHGRISTLKGKIIACDSDLPALTHNFKEMYTSLETLAGDLLNQVSRAGSGLSGRQLRWKRWEGNSNSRDCCGSGDRQRWHAAGMAMDIRDVRQMLAWLAKRLEMLRAEIDSPADGRDMPVTLRGFACSGSWMLGVLRNTHSPGLSWKLIEEMTSRESNRLRAEMGAGIPTRKDFYDFHGASAVPRIPEGFGMSWNSFLSQAGAKVRRRDRAVCSKVPLSQFSALLRTQLIRCVDAAESVRRVAVEDGQLTWNQLPDDTVLSRMNSVVDDATRQILLYVALEQEKGTTDREQKKDCPSINEEPLCDLCPLSCQPPEGSTCGVGLQASDVKHG